MTTPTTELSPTAVADAVRYLDSWIEFRQRRDRVPGVQAAVLHGDEVVLSTAHGRADLDDQTPLTPRHLFRIASHSKTFTATAIMQLVEQRRLRLDDAAARWVPFLTGSALADVTVRELLAHGGGVVRDGWDGDFWQLFDAFPDAERVQQVALDGADVLPRNQRFKYSNIGYALLGMVIEAASGTSYGAYVREHVVDRLGLRDTGPELDPARAVEYATGYTALSYGDERLPIEHVDTAAMAAATGFYSTAEDVVRYVAAHFHGDDRLLRDDSKRLMQRTEWKVEGGDTAYALGLAVVEVGGRRLLGHGGGYPGHITRTVFDPVDRLAVSVLTNAIDGPAQVLALGAVRFADLAAGVSDKAAPERASGADLASFRGRFANLWGVFDVVDLGGRLYQLDPTLDDPTAEPTHLEVVDQDTVRIARAPGYASHGETLTFDRRDDGTVRSVRGGSGSTSYPLEDLRDRLRSAGPVTRTSPLRIG